MTGATAAVSDAAEWSCTRRCRQDVYKRQGGFISAGAAQGELPEGQERVPWGMTVTRNSLVWCCLLYTSQRGGVENAELHRYAAIISARNESAVIGRLIRTLKEQDYPSELLDILKQQEYFSLHGFTNTPLPATPR